MKRRFGSAFRQGLAAVALVAGALGGGIAAAAPVALEGANYYWSDTEATFGTAAGATAQVLGLDGDWFNGTYQGDGGGLTTASAGYALFGASAVGLTTLGWMVSYSAPSLAPGQTAAVSLDWSANLVASYATLFGAAASGGMELELYRMVPGAFPFCLWYFDGTYWCPAQYWYYGYGETIAINDFTTPLGTLAAGERQMLLATFQVASAVETLPLIGFVAEAVDLGFMSFTLRADSGEPPAPPLPEPAPLGLLIAALAALGGVSRRAARRPVG